MTCAPQSAALDLLLAQGRTLRPARPGMLSALPATDQSAPYDRRAVVYDRVIANRIYNRLAWNAAPADYVAFAEEAITASDGAFLDAGCGTATFTAAAYRGTSRPLVLVDRSLDMLSRTASRLANTPVALVQADLLDLPFSPRRFATVA